MAACKFTIVVRAFSSPAQQHQLVKPPLAVYGIGGRYATALYSAATKAKDLDTVEKDLLKFQEGVKSDKKFRQFIQNPTIKRTVKMEAIKQIAAKLSFSKSSTNLLSLVADNGRLKDLNHIITAFSAIMAAHRGEITCEITSAKPLDDALKKELEGTLKKFAKANQTVHVTTKVNPEIIGGLIVTIGDKYVDMSIASKVKKYSDILQSGV